MEKGQVETDESENVPSNFKCGKRKVYDRGSLQLDSSFFTA